MTLREQYEALEKSTLSPRAALSSQTKGRRADEELCTLRTAYQRDRDRIIHTKSLRRLMHKTQVFIAPEGDHYRTRLTHTLEVSQIARTIARALRLNEDLTEAIALGHDLGHTPFGHCGERTLNALFPGGFEHNTQSLRVVDILEKERQGLNLCQEVRDGILNHRSATMPNTLEGRVVRYADRIAYLNHDIDDALRADVLSLGDLPRGPLKTLGYTHKERINTMITSIVEKSMDKDDIMMADDCQSAMMVLREAMFELVYKSPRATKEEDKVAYMLTFLYEYFEKRPDELPDEFKRALHAEGVSRSVCDYIAGMTDRYAISLFTSLFVPPSWKNL